MSEIFDTNEIIVFQAKLLALNLSHEDQPKFFESVSEMLAAIANTHRPHTMAEELATAFRLVRWPSNRDQP